MPDTSPHFVGARASGYPVGVPSAMPDQPRSPEPMVRLMTASSAFEARILSTILSEAGIPNHVPGESLADEFAVSQRLVNLQGADIHVPPDLVEQARAAIESARPETDARLEELAMAAGSEPDAETAPRPQPQVSPPSPGSGRKTLLIIGLVLLLAIVGSLWLDARASLARFEEDLLYTVQVTDLGWSGRWLHNGKLAYRATDEDYNGVPEKYEHFSRDGVLLSISFDEDQNGVFERIDSFDRSGRLADRSIDADQDGFFEVSESFLQDDTILRFTNPDGGFRLDRMQVLVDGEEVLVQRARGREGYVRED